MRWANHAPLAAQLIDHWHRGDGQKGSGSLQTNGAGLWGAGAVEIGHFRLLRNEVMRMWSSACDKLRFADSVAHKQNRNIPPIVPAALSAMKKYGPDRVATFANGRRWLRPPNPTSTGRNDKSFPSLRPPARKCDPHLPIRSSVPK